MSSVKHVANLSTYNAIQGNLSITGDIIINGQTIRFPSAAGNALEFLKALGSGNTAWAKPNLSELGDVAITSIANNNILKYQTSSSSWINSTLSKSDIGLGNVDNLSRAQLFTDPTFTGDVTCTGNLDVQGTTTHVNEQTVMDNKITVNFGETGSGVTAGYAGVVVDRGTATDYQFIFHEASQTFRVGQIGSEQAVATREDSPTDGGIPVWDNSSFKLSTALGLTAAETSQLKNINATTISTTQWGYLGAMNQSVATGQSVSFGSVIHTGSSNQIVMLPGGSGNTLTLTATNPSTTSRTFTIPDVGADSAFAMLAGSQTFSGAKTFSAAPVLTAASNQLVIQAGGSGNSLTLTAANPATASRTFTLPDVGTNTTFAMLDGAQTFAGIKTFNVAPVLTAASNQLVIQSNGTGNTLTLTAANPVTASRTFTLPDVGADSTFAMLAGSQTFSGAKTFSGGATVGTSLNLSYAALHSKFLTTDTSGNVVEQIVSPVSNQTQFTGTPGAGGTFTIGTVQDIGTGSSPTFASLKLSTLASILSATALLTWNSGTGDVKSIDSTSSATGSTAMLRDVSGASAVSALSATATSNQLALGTTNVTTLSTSANTSGSITQTLPMRAATLRSEDNNVLRVEKGGNDTNGARGGAPYLTITAAVAAAQSGDVIRVSAGTYSESNITVSTANISIIGDSAKHCIVSATVSSNSVRTFSLEAANILLSNFTVSISNSSATTPFTYGVASYYASNRIQNVAVSVTNTAASGGSNVYGVYIGQAESTTSIYNIDSCIVAAASPNDGSSTAAGVYQEGGGALAIRDTRMTASGAGSSFGLYLTTVASTTVYGGGIKGGSFDINNGISTPIMYGTLLETSGNVSFWSPPILNAASNQLVIRPSNTGNSLTLTAANPASASRTFTLPDVGADASFVMTAGSQTVGGAKTFSSAPVLTAASNQLVFQAGGSGNTLTLTAANPASASRTFTLPDVGADSTFAMLAGGQTFSGAKTFSTAPTLTPSSNQLVIQPGGSGNTFTLTATNPASSRVITLPDPGGAASILLTAGNQSASGVLTLTNATAAGSGTGALVSTGGVAASGYYSAGTYTSAQTTGTGFSAASITSGTGFTATAASSGGVGYSATASSNNAIGVSASATALNSTAIAVTGGALGGVGIAATSSSLGKVLSVISTSTGTTTNGTVTMSHTSSGDLMYLSNSSGTGKTLTLNGNTTAAALTISNSTVSMSASGQIQSTSTSNQIALGTTNVTTLSTSANTSGSITQTLPMRAATLRSEDKNIIRVEKSGSDTNGSRGGAPYLTLSAAAAAAQSGDTIIVYPGTYDESSSLNGVLLSANNVTIRGTDAARCIITTNNPLGNSGIYLNCTGALIQDLTITVTTNFITFVVAGCITSISTTNQLKNLTLNASHTGTGGIVIGILGSGASTQSTEMVNVDNCDIVATSTDASNSVYGYFSNSGYTSVIRNSNIIASGTGTTYGVFTNNAGDIVTLYGGSVKGTTGDIGGTGTTNQYGVVLKTAAVVSYAASTIATGSTGNLLGITLRNSIASYVPALLNYYENETVVSVSWAGPYASPVSANCRFSRIGNIVVARSVNFTGTSTSATSLTGSTIPTRFLPNVSQRFPAIVLTDNGTAQNNPGLLIVNTGGTFTINKTLDGSNFSATGTLTIQNWSVVYTTP